MLGLGPSMTAPLVAVAMPVTGPMPQFFGTMEARLCQTEAEKHATQKLRYRVFYDEMGADPLPQYLPEKREFDRYDDVCDTLMIIDHARGNGDDAVVGTYRLIRADAAKRAGGFYTAQEYDITPILGFAGNLLELGRSCVHPDYRNRPTMQLLWRGLAAYVFYHKIDLMFGCASFPGTNPHAFAQELAYLHHFHSCPQDLRPRCLPQFYQSMDLAPKDQVDAKAALHNLPPLIKGYMRLGGTFGDGAYIDRQFNSVDVLVMVQTATMSDKYFRYYERTTIMETETEGV